LRTVEADADMALGGEIIDFLRLNFAHQTSQRAGVGKVAVMQEETIVADVGVFVDGIEATGVEGAGASDDAMDFIALTKQKLSEIRAILARNTGNKCAFGHTESGQPQRMPGQWQVPNLVGSPR